MKSAEKADERPDPLSKYSYLKAPERAVFPGVSEDYGLHQSAIHHSGAVAVLAAATEWEKFVLAGSFDVKRTMRVGDQEVILRQFMALWCVGVRAGEIRDRIVYIDGTHHAGLGESQLATVGLPAMERRAEYGFHSGTFNEVPHNAFRALMYHAFEIPQVVGIEGSSSQAA